MPNQNKKLAKPWKLVCNVEGFIASYSTEAAAEAAREKHKRPGHKPKVEESQHADSARLSKKQAIFGVSKTTMKKFDNLGITLEIFDAVVEHLIKEGFLKYCGTRTGCDDTCPSGEECERSGSNCLCRRVP